MPILDIGSSFLNRAGVRFLPAFCSRLYYEAEAVALQDAASTLNLETVCQSMTSMFSKTASWTNVVP